MTADSDCRNQRVSFTTKDLLTASKFALLQKEATPTPEGTKKKEGIIGGPLRQIAELEKYAAAMVG
jgi:hypothetical protein